MESIYIVIVSNSLNFRKCFSDIISDLNSELTCKSADVNEFLKMNLQSKNMDLLILDLPKNNQLIYELGLCLVHTTKLSKVLVSCSPSILSQILSLQHIQKLYPLIYSWDNKDILREHIAAIVTDSIVEDPIP